MPVLLERASQSDLPRQTRFAHPGRRALDIALVNNMPDAALESTERQFTRLLASAAKDIPVRLHLFSISEIARSEAARAHLAGTYRDLDQIWDAQLDAVIVTGTEPRAASLRDEPYWASIAKLADWSEANSVSTAWSCLAAHAAVLHKDGITRSPLAQKCFGFFECKRASRHPLLERTPLRISVPHSRWNELPEETLRAAGYTILTRSSAAGVDAFAKHHNGDGNAPTLFFQGHPEYDERALFREYRRDVARYLRGERETYPGIPVNYFDAAAAKVAGQFKDLALVHRREELMVRFPAAALQAGLRRGAGSTATTIYNNWISHLWLQNAPTRYRPAAVTLVRAPQFAATVSDDALN